jgi:predicted ArsR family transcriptional regulator
MDVPLTDPVAAVAALSEPTRRRLYEYVARHPAPVGRDDVAAALQIPRATAVFHLDKLVEEDLLTVTHERRTGRSGPGAGRPAKLYRRSTRQVSVSLPERRYDLAGQLLAGALEEADQSGESPRAILDRRAYRLGVELGESTQAGHEADAVLAVLEAQGFEPRVQEDTQVLLENCPFHTLARAHTQTVCGMNLNLVTGLLSGLGNTRLLARLDPRPGHCCVRLEPAQP